MSSTHRLAVSIHSSEIRVALGTATECISNCAIPEQTLTKHKKLQDFYTHLKLQPFTNPSLNNTQKQMKKAKCRWCWEAFIACGKCTGGCGHLSEVLSGVGSAQLSDLKTPNYPDHINGQQRLHFVIKVKQLVSIHKDPKTLVLTMDLNLHNRKKGEGDRKEWNEIKSKESFVSYWDSLWIACWKRGLVWLKRLWIDLVLNWPIFALL